jgi:hypothetical protein
MAWFSRVAGRAHRQQGKGIMLRHCLVICAGLCCAGPAAASWADSLFESLSKDFGSVPRGSTLTHLFRLTNKTEQPISVTGLRVSCGCVSASAMQPTVAPGQSTVIVAQMDTSRFAGVRSVTIHVSLGPPANEEVRLWVQANSRDDVSIVPEALAHGQIKRGVSSAKSVTITFLGNGEWQILGSQCESNYVQTTIKEQRRDGGQVTYEVTAALRSDTPVGKWYSDVWLKTNHQSMPRVRIPLTVEVESNLSLSPSTVNLGEVKVGAKVERRAILRGVRPFKILSFSGTDDGLTVKDSATDSMPVHVLTITLHPDKAGDLTRAIRVITDLEGEGEIEFQAQAKVIP